MTKTRIILIVILSALMGYAGYYYGGFLPISSQMKLLDPLVTLSAVVFAIMGIWLAVVFPNVISGVYKESSSVAKKQLLFKAKRLLTPLLIATFVSISTIVVRIISEILLVKIHNIDQSIPRGLFFNYIIFSSLALIVALVLSVAPGLQMLFEADRSHKTCQKKERFCSNSDTSKDA